MKKSKVIFGLVIVMLFSLVLISCREKNSAVVEQALPTVKEATASFMEAKNAYTVEQIYFALPEATYVTIVNRIGTNATMEEVVKEYQRNKTYYISLQLSETIGSIPIEGPDANNVESVNMDITLKAPDTAKVPVTVAPIPAPTVPNHIR